MAEAPFGGVQTGPVIYNCIDAESPDCFRPDLFDQDDASFEDRKAAAVLLEDGFAILGTPDAETTDAIELFNGAQERVAGLSPYTRVAYGAVIITRLVKHDLANRANLADQNKFPHISSTTVASHYHQVQPALEEARRDGYTPGKSVASLRLHVAGHGLAVRSEHIMPRLILSEARACVGEQGTPAEKDCHRDLFTASRLEAFIKSRQAFRARDVLGMLSLVPEAELAD